MGDRAWWGEVLGAAAFALIVPLAISVLGRRLSPAGAIAGVALASLRHVTAVVFALYVAVPVAETVISGPEATGPDVRENLQRAALGAWLVTGDPGSSSQTAS